MQSDIVQHATKAISQTFCFKCRCHNKLRKQSFARDDLTLEELLTWVSDVHCIALDDLKLEYRGSDNSWIPLDSRVALEAAVEPVLRGGGDGNPTSIFTRASSINDPDHNASSAVAAPAVAASPPEAGVLESAVLVSTSAPLTDFENGDNCRECGISFGYIFGRRHHCRVCLRSFCHDCADGFFPIVGNPTPVRHCGSCATTPLAQQREAEERARELATVERDLDAAVETQNYAEAAKLKERKEQLEAATAAAAQW